MPRLWNHTIEAHHRSVSEAVFAATADIISRTGFGALSMARVAQDAGIGRATLYKYFRDIDEVLVAWHEHAIGKHVAVLEEVKAAHSDPLEAFEAVLMAYGELRRDHHGHPAAMLHSLPHIRHAQDRLRAHLCELIAKAAKQGSIRKDIPADELAAFAIAAMEAGTTATNKTAVQRNVAMILKAAAP